MQNNHWNIKVDQVPKKSPIEFKDISIECVFSQ